MSRKASINEGINVRVAVEFQPNYSFPYSRNYIFAYHITIENNTTYMVQLLRRYWEIIDGLGSKRIVEGEGVIGIQPILDAGEAHQYSSWSQTSTRIGCMRGYYQMLRLDDNLLFDVVIPTFHLITPELLN